MGITLILAAPGPTNALLASAGSDGLRRPWALIAAVLAGYGLAVAALRLVGAPAIAVVPALAPILRLVLAVYLAFLGCCLWRRNGDAGGDAVVSPGRIFVATLLNPKAAIFAFALFPEGRSGVDLLPWVLGFAVVVVACASGWYVVGERARRFGGAPAARLLPRLASAVLIFFSVFIAATTVATIV